MDEKRLLDFNPGAETASEAAGIPYFTLAKKSSARVRYSRGGLGSHPSDPGSSPGGEILACRFVAGLHDADSKPGPAAWRADMADLKNIWMIGA